jgi:tetratricopeptide (TPR) repeat protein
MLVTLPFLLLLLDVWPLGRLRPDAPGAARTLGRLALEKLPLLLLAAGTALLTTIAQQRGAAVAKLPAFPLADRVANALTAYGAYLRLTFWPSGLSAFHVYERVPLFGWKTAAAALALVALTAVALRRWRRSPWLATGWLWFLGTLVPVIGLVHTGDQAYAERYTYVPVIGLFVALSWGAAALQARRGIPRELLAAPALGAIAALSVAAFVQTGYWRDDLTLFGRAIALNPRNWVAHNNLGVALAKRGRSDEAFEQFSLAVAARPTYADARYNLALELYDRQRLDEAAAQYREVIRLRPDNQGAHVNLGAILFRQGDLDGAIARYREALRLRPGDPGGLDALRELRSAPGQAPASASP